MQVAALITGSTGGAVGIWRRRRLLRVGIRLLSTPRGERVRTRRGPLALAGLPLPAAGCKSRARALCLDVKDSAVYAGYAGAGSHLVTCALGYCRQVSCGRQRREGAAAPLLLAGLAWISPVAAATWTVPSGTVMPPGESARTARFAGLWTCWAAHRWARFGTA